MTKRIDWEAESQSYDRILSALEDKVLTTLRLWAAAVDAPQGTIPYLLRHIHRQLEKEAREQALKIELRLAMPEEQEAEFMEAYPELRAQAQRYGFEEVGQFMAYSALMGLTDPLTAEEFDEKKGEDDDDD